MQFKQSDLPILAKMVRLIENSRQSLGKDYFRAVEVAKTVFSENDKTKINQYQTKVDQNTLISESK
ncbi:MAG: hypothetical protein IPP61_00185 [Cytophagaceae bacterium]|mgnify:CR=1 FL=1|nr:hypothetical protein [Cytophagaceae bacterium]MBL0323597.1 hypothetical protein [Cytophagaceae bacterium]